MREADKLKSGDDVAVYSLVARPRIPVDSGRATGKGAR